MTTGIIRLKVAKKTDENFRILQNTCRFPLQQVPMHQYLENAVECFLASSQLLTLLFLLYREVLDHGHTDHMVSHHVDLSKQEVVKIYY